jgi:tetratricopeptide (TPR) repeat protein
MWLDQARTFSDIRDWKRARDCATQAIRIAPHLIDGYMLRALALRVVGDLDGGIEDYTKVIELDQQHGEAWMFRGACKTQKASSIQERAQALSLLKDAHPDYQRAAELMPDNEQAGLALLELEICAGKYREAVGTTGVWWNRIQAPGNKVICAWLASIAFILAGRPTQKWAHFRQLLESDSTRLSPTEWSVAEISGALQDLTQRRAADPDRLAALTDVHKLFLRHFTKEGPAIPGN